MREKDLPAIVCGPMCRMAVVDAEEKGKGEYHRTNELADIFDDHIVLIDVTCTEKTQVVNRAALHHCAGLCSKPLIHPAHQRMSHGPISSSPSRIMSEAKCHGDKARVQPWHAKKVPFEVFSVLHVGLVLGCSHTFLRIRTPQSLLSLSIVRGHCPCKPEEGRPPTQAQRLCTSRQDAPWLCSSSCGA